jgi:copper transport protein
MLVIWRGGLAFTFLLLTGLASPSPAFGHASLLRTEPASGAIVAHAPDALKLVFNEPVSPLVFQLVGGDGHRFPLQQITNDGAMLVIALPPARGSGTHVVSWRVVSADGHPVGGSFSFSVGERSAGELAAPQTQSDLSVRIALWALRLAIYLGLFVGAGGAFHRTFVAAPQALAVTAQRAMSATLIVGTVAAMLSIGAQGLDALARPLTDIFASDVWAAGLATSYRYTAEIATWTMIAALFSTQASHPLFAKLFAAAALAGTGAALAVSGHAGNAEPHWLTRSAVFVHAAGVAVWAGALIPLMTRLRTPDAAMPELRRFGWTIPPILGAMLVAGVVLALIQVERIDALWTTAYGIVLSCKLAAVAIVLALAVWNRLWLTPKLERGEEVEKKFAASIRAEIAIIVVVLGLVALWRFTPPPRVLAAAAAEPVFVHFHTNEAMAEFTIEPVRSRQAVILQLLNGEFGPLDAKEVDFALSKPDAGIEPMRWHAKRVEGGTWRVDDVQFPLGGVWRARIEILINDFERIGIEDTIDLPR